MLDVILLCVWQTKGLSALTSSIVSFQLPARGQECVYDEVYTTGDKLFIHYSVTEGVYEDLEVCIYGPDKGEIFCAEKSAEERFLFRVAGPGKYCTCFKSIKGNGLKTISYMSQTESEDSVQSTESRNFNLKKSEGIEDMEGSLLRITSGLKEIRSEQTYLSNRERIHRQTAERTQSRFIMWGLIEMIIMGCISALQVRLLKKCFESNRSI